MPLIVKLYYTWGKDFETALECLIALFTQAVMIIKYANGMNEQKKIKFILQNIKNDSERLKNHPEYNVLYKYTMEGRKYAVSFIGFILALVLVYVLLASALVVSDYMAKNETEEKYLLYKVEYYFFDAQEYYYFAIVHSFIITIEIIVIFLPLDTMYITFVQHACALFAVTGYRLKTAHILYADALRNKKVTGTQGHKEISAGEQEQVYEKLVLCIEEHKGALEFTKIVQSMYSKALFFQVSLNIVSMSMTGVMALLKISNIRDTIRLETWLVGQYTHLFFLCLPGQRLMDFSAQVYYDALECMWYLFYTRSRIIYQFLIMNTLTPITITALKVMTLNLETLLSVTQAAVSYFTVLSSSL